MKTVEGENRGDRGGKRPERVRELTDGRKAKIIDGEKSEERKKTMKFNGVDLHCFTLGSALG